VASGGAAGLSLRSGYRLWDVLLGAQSRIRTALSGLTPPPASEDRRPMAQMLAHLRCAFTGAACTLAWFQVTLQRGLFG
jgi:hypothetical protein